MCGYNYKTNSKGKGNRWNFHNASKISRKLEKYYQEVKKHWRHTKFTWSKMNNAHQKFFKHFHISGNYFISALQLISGNHTRRLWTCAEISVTQNDECLKIVIFREKSGTRWIFSFECCPQTHLCHLVSIPPRLWPGEISVQHFKAQFENSLHWKWQLKFDLTSSNCF